jgi:hypothetical protein
MMTESFCSFEAGIYAAKAKMDVSIAMVETPLRADQYLKLWRLVEYS